MSDELSHLNVEVYSGPESELPEPGVENRFYKVTEGGSLWNDNDLLRDTGDSWEKQDLGVGSLTTERVGIEESTDEVPDDFVGLARDEQTGGPVLYAEEL